MEIPKINLEITIGENQTATLKINPDEDIEAKVQAFCKKYKLGEDIKSILMDNIIQSIKRENENIAEEDEEDENDSSQRKTECSRKISNNKFLRKENSFS